MDASSRIDEERGQRHIRRLLGSLRPTSADRRKQILSAISVVVLFGTPYVLLNPSFGPRRTAVYAVIAVGCLAGALVAERIPSTMRTALASAKARAIALCMCVMVSLPEWIAVTVPSMTPLDAGLSHVVPRIAQSVALFALAATSAAQLSLGSKPRSTAGEKRSEVKPAPLLAMSFCWMSLGILFRMLWVALTAGNDGTLAAYGHIGLAAPPVLVFIAVGTMVLCDEARPDHNPSLPLMIASFSCGVILWNILTRAVPAHDMVQSSCLPAISAVIALLLGTGTALANRPPNSRENFFEREERSCSVVAAERLKGLSLTQREQEIASAALGGATSAELAHRFGISASTVRNHLTRVYRKASVNSIRELRDMLGIGDRRTIPVGGTSRIAVPSEDNVPQVTTSVSCGLGVLSSSLQPLIAVATIMLAGTLCLPHGTVLDWGYGRPVALAGAAAGMTLAPLLMSVLPRTRTLLKHIAQLLVTAACVAYLASFPGQSWDDALALRTPDRCLAIFAISAAVLASLPALMYCEHSTESSGQRNVRTYVSAAAVVTSIGLSHLPAHLLRAVSATAVAVLAPASMLIDLLLSQRQNAAFAVKARRTSGTAVANIQSVTLAATTSTATILVIALTLGLSFEEIWRAAGSTSLEIVLTPALIAIDIVLAALSAMQSNGRQRIETVAPLLAVSFVVGTSYFEKLFLAGLILFVNLPTASGKLHDQDKGILGIASLAFSAGVLIGDIGVNLYGDLLTDLIRSATYEGAQPLRLVAAGTVGALCVTLAFVLSKGSYLQTVGSQHSFATPDDEKRLAAYLAYRGLSDTQVDVLLRIARGMTGAEIAADLHIARGTVNSARAAGYAALKVHSKQQLKDRLFSLLEA